MIVPGPGGRAAGPGRNESHGSVDIIENGAMHLRTFRLNQPNSTKHLKHLSTVELLLVGSGVIFPSIILQSNPGQDLTDFNVPGRGREGRLRRGGHNGCLFEHNQ